MFCAFWLLMVLLSRPVSLASRLERTALPVALAAALVAREWLEPHETREHVRAWARAFRGYTASTPRALGELFAGESVAGDVPIAVAVDGILRGAETGPRAPLTGSACAAWKVEVDLVRSEDLAAGARMKPGAVPDTLLSKISASGLRLEEQGSAVAIGAGAELVLGTPVERIVSWDGLHAERHEIRTAIDEAMSLQRIERHDFSGVRIREALLPDGTPVTVYGLARKKPHGIEIDAPQHEGGEPLMITTVPLRALAGGAHARLHPAAIVRVGGAVALAAVPVVSWLNPGKHGTIEYAASTHSLRIEVQGRDGESASTWTFDGSDEVGEHVTLLHGEIPFLADAGTELTLFALTDSSAESYVIGRDPPVQWVGSQWLLDLARPRATATPAPEHTAEFRVKNETARHLRLEFPKTKGASTFSWPFDPYEGGASATGTRLLNGEKPLQIATGEVLDVYASVANSDGEPTWVTSFFVGYGPEIEWVDGSGWLFPADEARIAFRAGNLGVRNDTGDSYEIVAFDKSGLRIGSSWNLDAGDGGSLDMGTELDIGDDAVQFLPGERIELRHRASRRIWAGRLADCPWAAFSRTANRWSLELPDGAYAMPVSGGAAHARAGR